MLWIALIIGLLLVLPAKSRSGATDLGFLILLIVACCFAYSLVCWTGNEAVSFWNGPVLPAIGQAIFSVFKGICIAIYLILAAGFWIIVAPIIIMLIGFASVLKKF